MANDRLVRISPDGKTVTFLFHDEFPLNVLGEQTIVRASHIKFDNIDKLWYVYLRHTDGRELKSAIGYTTRKKALDHEVEVCEGILQTLPEMVDSVIANCTELDETLHETSG